MFQSGGNKFKVLALDLGVSIDWSEGLAQGARQARVCPRTESYEGGHDGRGVA